MNRAEDQDHHKQADSEGAAKAIIIHAKIPHLPRKTVFRTRVLVRMH